MNITQNVVWASENPMLEGFGQGIRKKVYFLTPFDIEYKLTF